MATEHEKDPDVTEMLRNIPKGRPKSGRVWKADRPRAHRYNYSGPFILSERLPSQMTLT